MRVVLATAAVAALCVVLAPPSGAAVRSCRARVDFNLVISSARNMRCATAASEMRRYRGSISRRFRTPRGFTCTRVSGTRLGGQWRCVRRSLAFRFEFGD